MAAILLLMPGRTRGESPPKRKLPELQTRYQQLRATFEKNWLAERGGSAAFPDDWPLVPADPSRIYFFIPQEITGREPDSVTATTPGPHPSQTSHATQLTDLIQSADPSADRGLLYRWTHEILALDASQSTARRWLRLPSAASSTSRPSDRMTVRRPRRAHARFGWRPSEYLTLDSRHYRITTNDTEDSALALAEDLECLYSVWHQQFHRLWSSAGGSRPKALHQVVLFRDHADYIAHIKTIEPQAEVTRGYYHGPTRTAYFVGGEQPPKATWFHEATHQLFHERMTTIRHVGVQHNFWVIEGIALYFESFDRQGNRASLGGLEADRLQFARYRALRENATVPLEAFASWNQQQWQAHPRIHANYSQAAGITHFLMHAEEGRFRPALERLLELVYTGRDEPDSLAKLTERAWPELEDAYLRFLRIDDEDLLQVPSYVRPRQLSLCGTQVTDEGMKQLHLDECEWLDASGLKLSDAGLSQLKTAHRMRQLTLENTSTTDATVSLISAKAPLVELDLSQTQVTDAAIPQILRFQHLESLWLTQTSVTDEGVKQLETLPRLRFLELTSTPTSPSVRAKWAQRQQASQAEARSDESATARSP